MGARALQARGVEPTRPLTPLAIVAALPHEARCFRAVPRDLREPLELSSGVWLCISGVGPACARETALLLLEQGARGIVSWGCAGGLDPSLAPGSLVLADEVLTAGGERLPADAGWRARIEQRLAGQVRVNGGAIVESARVVKTAAEKAELFRTTGARAVDMESGALAEAARARGAAFLAVRAICDTARDPIPRAARVALDADGALRLGPLLAALVARPLDAAGLVKLRSGLARTRETLARVLDVSGEELCSRG